MENTQMKHTPTGSNYEPPDLVKRVLRSLVDNIAKVEETGLPPGVHLLAVAGKTGQVFGFSFAVESGPNVTPEQTMHTLLMDFALGAEPAAFACAVECWFAKIGVGDDAMAEGIERMIERGALPPASQHPDRKDGYLLNVGDHTSTFYGVMERGEKRVVNLNKAAPDHKHVMFTLEVFDAATLRQAEANSGHDIDLYRRLARARLLTNLGPEKFALLMASMGVEPEGER